MPYAIRYAPAARRWLRKRDKSEQRRLLAAIDDLANDPRAAGCKKLSGHQSLWRIRVGPFRVVYRINDGNLLPVRMGSASFPPYDAEAPNVLVLIVDTHGAVNTKGMG